MCNDMEDEINDLLHPGSKEKDKTKKSALPNIDIDEMYANLLQLEEEGKFPSPPTSLTETQKEGFWREIELSDDPFETIAFYISKGYLSNI